LAIGTSTAPSYPLDVAGSVNATTYYGDGGNLTGISTGQWTDGGTYIYANNATNVVVTDAGSVGIGTTTPNNLLSVYQLIDFNNTDYNTKLGYQAGKNILGGATRNTFIGYQAGMASSTASTDAADYNTGIGYQTLYFNTTGQQNTANGHGALRNNTTGNYNTANGMYALLDNTTGNYNTAVGNSALYNNTTGTSSIAFGYRAGYNNTTGSNNIVIGYQTNLPAVDSSNMLSIGNLIYATGLTTFANPSSAVSSGNVGIGTTSPGYKLHVVGDIYTEGKIYGGTRCPSDMAYIPGDQPFCIDKYEAYNAGGTVVNGTCNTGTQAEVNANTTTAVAGSAPGQTPRVSINYCAAKKMCQNAGKHLCTNPEWFHACNYKGSQWNITAEQSAETMACNTDTAVTALTGASDTCVTQEGVYDMIGNVWELVDKVVAADPTNGLVSNWVTGYDFATALPTSVGASDDAYGNDRYTYYLADNISVFQRGGASNQGANSGCFTLSHGASPYTSSAWIGFRCCQ